MLALDCLGLILGCAALLIALTGGSHVMVSGVRLSASNPLRPLLLLLLVAGVRLALDRRSPFLLSRQADWWRRWSRVYRPDADPSGTSAIPWRASAAGALGMCAVAVVLLWPQLRQMHAVPDFGDPLLSMWRAGWVLEQLRGDPRPFFDANIFNPEPLTFTYSDSMLLPALTAAPALVAGMSPVLAYNLLLISGFVFSGIAAALLVERLTGSSRAGFVAGIVFGFYPYHFEHYSHLELQMMQWMPLSLLALHRFLETYRWPWALAAGLCAVAQLYSAMYYAVFFSLYGGVVLAVLVLTRRPSLKRLIIPAVLSAAVAIALVLPLARAYSEATKTKGERGREEVQLFSATPSDYLRAHFRSAIYGSRMLPGRLPERALFPGLVPIALAAVGLVPPLGSIRLAYTAGLLLAFDGSLGFNGLSYPLLFDWLSPIRGLRVPARFSVLVALSLAVLGGFGMQRLLAARATATASRAMFAATVIAAVVNVWPNLPLREVWPEPPPIYGALAGVPHVVLAEFPVPVDYGFNTPYMYFSIWHWRQMVNGYSGFLPHSYEQFQLDVTDFPDPSSIAALRVLGVTHVTVNCAFYRGGCDELLTRLDGLPDLRKVAEGRWQGQRVRLFELQR